MIGKSGLINDGEEGRSRVNTDVGQRFVRLTTSLVYLWTSWIPVNNLLRNWRKLQFHQTEMPCCLKFPWQQICMVGRCSLSSWIAEFCKRLGDLELTTPKQPLRFIRPIRTAVHFQIFKLTSRFYQKFYISITSCEGSLSKIKLTLPSLSASMSEDRLSALALLSAERVATVKISFNEVTDTFAKVKAKRIFIFPTNLNHQTDTL